MRPQGAIVRRTTRRYGSLAELAPSFRAIHKQLFGIDTAKVSLLIDLRAIVGRNDPEFEAALAPLRRELLLCFGRVALLVRTTIGGLQLERYLASDGIVARVFAHEPLAMAWFLDERDPPQAQGADLRKRGG